MTTRMLDAEIAFPAQCELAEGPVWDVAPGAAPLGGHPPRPGARTRRDQRELRRYTPDGRLDTIVKLPVTQVSSAAFGART